MNSNVHCFTLPPDVPFLSKLASWLLDQYGKDSSQFTKVLVLLPNRRACRSLREVFLEITGGKPLLLPRIQPIGELDGEGFLLNQPINNTTKQSIAPVRRHFLLTQLVMRFQQKHSGGSIEQAAELAKQLANFIDDVAREGLSLNKLTELVPTELAHHWQLTLNFLNIISHEWPKLLAEEGVLDPVTYRNDLLAQIRKIWENEPPDYPIIAAGSTGSQPATAALLSTIARLPHGVVVLPSLDKHMPNVDWNSITDTHPQYAIIHLLNYMKIVREEVDFLTPPAQQNNRDIVLRAVFAPPAITSDWAHSDLPMKEGLQGMYMLEADTLLDEARMIAISMREALEIPEKTVALITTDRTLARMVASYLQRFNIEIDDSAGKQLNTSAPGCFVRLAIEMVASRAAPTALLTLLRHPLAGAGMDTATCRRLSRELELELLRGIRRKSGVSALRDATKNTKLRFFLDTLAERMQPLVELFQPDKIVTFKKLLSEHIAFAEWLASTNEISGEKRLWAGDAGNALASFISEIHAQADVLPAIDPLIYPGLFDTLLSPETYHSRFGHHPRLHILSPMEARLQHFDRVILGGMNEGVWPKSTSADPWMSRPMRQVFGLPSPEKIIGQSAQDVMQLCAAPEVIISRARKVDGTPTVPSRWWMRLKTLVDGRAHQIFLNMQQEDYYLAAKSLLEKPAEIIPLSAPEPTPPFSARPRKLRVTAIDQWLKDPYMVYAKYILKLHKLDKIDREPDASDFGNIVHKALEIFTREYPNQLPDNAIEKLLASGEKAFADFIDRPAVACLWWPRFEAMTQWLLDTELNRRNHIQRVISEVSGTWTLQVDQHNFTLLTRIDRLEERINGEIVLVDYKTGTLPSNTAIKNGLANQLALEALIIMYGELSQPVTGNIISQMEYWKLAGEEVKCNITPVPLDTKDIRERLETLIRKFDNSCTPYTAQTGPLPETTYNDYEHLTRRNEWEAI